MDLIFEIAKKESQNMANLLKQMCALKCRGKLDTKEGRITLLGMDYHEIDSIIDAIDDVFEIITADIIPTGDVDDSVSFSKQKKDETSDHILM